MGQYIKQNFRSKMTKSKFKKANRASYLDDLCSTHIKTLIKDIF